MASPWERLVACRCGDEATVRVHDNRWWVECSWRNRRHDLEDCPMVGGFDGFETQEEAVMAWNRLMGATDDAESGSEDLKGLLLDYDEMLSLVLDNYDGRESALFGSILATLRSRASELGVEGCGKRAMDERDRLVAENDGLRDVARELYVTLCQYTSYDGALEPYRDELERLGIEVEP